MSVLERLSEEEKYLLAILQDKSGIDLAEFMWQDETSKEGVFRCWDYQYYWYRTYDRYQVDQCARAVGKSVGIQMRAFAFPFLYPGEEMLITAPELIHLDPITKAVEERLTTVRMSREMLETRRGKAGIVRRPFEARFRNGARIIGRIPQKDGRGIKGTHPLKLEMDEAQDYPDAGWIELTETLRYGQPDSSWRAHGVTRGVRDYFHKMTQPESGWTVHNITAIHRPDWSDEERRNKSDIYGSRHSPDYRRNIMGAHGDAQNPLFVLARLMRTVDTNETSEYNTEYQHIRISNEAYEKEAAPIENLLGFNPEHTKYQRVWVGADIGVTNHPTEILGFAEVPKGTSFTDDPDDMIMKLILRIHLERISTPVQREVFAAINDFYHPQAIAIDKTGVGLPLFQEVIEGQDKALSRVFKGYNFSEKIQVGWEEIPKMDEWGQIDEPEVIMANVLEYSSDQLRLLVDRQQIKLPWDLELLREFQGQTFVLQKSTQNPYGRKVFNAGSFHTLDAARMAVLAWKQRYIEAMIKAAKPKHEMVLDSFVSF